VTGTITAPSAIAMTIVTEIAIGIGITTIAMTGETISAGNI
jgi:hypothetical protein